MLRVDIQNASRFAFVSQPARFEITSTIVGDYGHENSRAGWNVILTDPSMFRLRHGEGY